MKVDINSFNPLKAPITTAADDSLEYFFIVFQGKGDLGFHLNK